MTERQVIDFIKRHGVVLERARGTLPNLVEAIVGAPVRGSWWAHPQAQSIFRLLEFVHDSPDVLVCRLMDGKVTLAHRRVWPALVRLADRLPKNRLAAVRQVHTRSGRHAVETVPYRRWMPDEIIAQARRLDAGKAVMLLPAPVRALLSAPKKPTR